MDLKEFAQDFLDTVDAMVDMNDANREDELTSSILDYIQDTGEVAVPTICPLKARGMALSAFDYNDESNSLDLFLLVEPDTFLGKVNGNKIDGAYSKMTLFYQDSMSGEILEGANHINDELKEAVELIQSTKGQVAVIREFVLSSGLVDPNYNPITFEYQDGIIIQQHIWDMQRVYQQHRIKSGREKIEVDFPTTYGVQIPCIKVNSVNTDIESYLAIIPGITLAQIYKNYQQALLESNVRTFLQFKAKVNKGIRDTLKNSPEKFFSFNNGISTTASAITIIERDGGMYISNIENWQIVNGGQTTASIAATYSERGSDLSKVFVPMKVSVIHDEEHIKDTVGEISRYANSQTAVKESDFSSNDPYLVEMERLSRETWVPNGANKATTKWYFERTRGQYLDELAQQNSSFNEKQFRINYPKYNKFAKTELAKFEMCWEQRPELVCRGAEKNYITFVKLVQESRPIVSELYYKRIVAKAILYKKIDKMVNAKKLGGYKSNMDAYILSALSFMSRKALDLDYIWDHQSIQKELEGIIEQLIPIVWEHLTEASIAGVSQSSNVNEWTKKSDCWNNLRLQLDELAKDMPDSLKLSPEKMLDASLTQAQNAKIAEAMEIDKEVWFDIAKWARTNNKLTPIERKMLYNLGMLKSMNRSFTLKQAQTGLKMIDTAKQLGYTDNWDNKLF